MTEPAIPAGKLGASAEAMASAPASFRDGREAPPRDVPSPVFAVAAPRSLRAVAEAVVLTAAFPALGWLVDPTDPFLLKHPFPWVVFAPLLVGLRHGFAAGCTSAVVLGGALVASWRARALGVVDFPAELFLGLFALAMLTGQFSDVWRRDIRRLGAGFEGTKRRAGELARAQFLLELSHERLREENAGAPNLREALEVVSKLAASADGSWTPIADRMMSIFAAYAMLEAGVVLRIDARGRDAGIIASVGRVEAVDDDDPLLRAAVRERELVYVPSQSGDDADASERSRLLAAVPFVDATGELRAVLCVQSMPFAAFHKKNLETLAILAGHFTDLVAARDAGVDPERARRTEFEDSLARAIHDRRAYGVPSTVAAFWMRRSSAVTAVSDVVLGALLRPTDTPFLTADPFGNVLVLASMPATDAGAARGIQARVDAIVRRELDASLADAGAALALQPVGADDTVTALVERAAQQVQAP